MKRNSSLLYSIVIAIAPTFATAQTWLTAAPTATSYYGGTLVNFQNNTTGTLLLTGRFDLNLSGNGGFSNDYQVYTKSSALAGSETNAAAWSLLGSSHVASTNAQGSFTTIDVGNTISVAAGQTIGLAFFVANADASGGYMGYRTGANTYSDSSATITTGLAKGFRGGFSPTTDQLFDVDTFNPRTWSGRVEYQAVPEPVSLVAMGLGLAGFVSKRRKRS